MEGLSHYGEVAARGSLIALVGGFAFTDVHFGQTAGAGLFSHIGWYHLVVAGAATTGVLAATSSYQSKIRHIPTTIATDTYGALCLGYFLAKSMCSVCSTWSCLKELWLGPTARTLNDLCWEGMWAGAMASAALGTGGGAIAFSGALREKESWAVQWEQRSHNFWAALFGLAGQDGKGLREAAQELAESIKESFPLLSKQYRQSDRIASHPKLYEGRMGQLVAADRVVAKGVYYCVWGGFHLAALRASPFFFSAGVVARLLDMPYTDRFRNSHFVFFERGADGFADRSYRDRLFYLACLGLGGVLMNCWLHAGGMLLNVDCLCIQIDYFLPFALGVLGAELSMRGWERREEVMRQVASLSRSSFFNGRGGMKL